MLLQTAIERRNEELVKMLLDQKIDINAPNCDGKTPLHFAVEVGYKEMAEILLRNGASFSNTSLLHLAVEKGDERMTKLLIKSGADVNAEDSKNKQIPMYYAIKNTNAQLVVQLLNAGASVQNYVKLLVEEGTDVNTRDKYGRTALHQVLRLLRPNTYADKYLDLSLPLKPEKKCSRFFDELEEMLLTLFKNGADVNATDCYGLTPLDYVSTTNNHGFATLLLKQIAKISAAGLHESGNSLRFMERTERLKNFYDECQREIARAKIEKIDDKVTFYNILSVKDGNRLAKYTRNARIVQVLESKECAERYRIYGVDLNSMLVEGKERLPLVNLAADSISYFCQFFMPSLIAEKILNYLGRKDLERLIEAYQELTESMTTID